MQSHCLNAQISFRISLCSSSSLPLQQCLSNISLCSVNSLWNAQFSHWARLGWFWCLPSMRLGKMSALSKQPFGEADRRTLFWQPVRPALGPSWTTTMSDLPSWHHENVNSQFSICLGNYQFWSKSFWYAGLWVLRMDFDTSILSSAWPERLMSGLRTIC